MVKYIAQSIESSKSGTVLEFGQFVLHRRVVART